MMSEQQQKQQQLMNCHWPKVIILIDDCKYSFRSHFEYSAGDYIPRKHLQFAQLLSLGRFVVDWNMSRNE